MEDRQKVLQHKLDALAQHPARDRERVDLLNAAGEGLAVDDPRQALNYAAEALQLAETLSYERGRGYALGVSGFAHYMLSDHEQAGPLFFQAKEIMEELGEAEGLARVLSGLASVQQSLGNFEQAFSYAFQALKILEKVGNQRGVGWCLNGIGTGYHEMGDYQKAIDYQLRSLEIFEKFDEKVGEARALCGIGTIYQSLGDAELARLYHLKSLDIFRAINNRIGEARALNDLGLIFQSLGDLEQARSYLEEARQIRVQIGNRQAESTSLINLGKLYLQQEQLEEALELLHRALEIAEAIKVKPRIYQAHQALSLVYEKYGDLAKALAHYKAFQEVRDEVSGDEAGARLRNLQIAFEIEKSQREAEITRLRNVELKEKNEQLEKLLAELQATQGQLIQSEKMAALGSLVAGIAHEINTPIGAIKSAADVSGRCIATIAASLQRAPSLEALQQDKQFVRALKALEDNNGVSDTASERILKIVKSLKSFTRLDQAEFQKADLHEGLESALTLLEPELRERIEVQRAYGDIPLVYCYQGEINQVFMNLLTNAAEAIKGRGIISIHTSRSGAREVAVQIRDNGVGIPESRLGDLFTPKFSREGARVKAGIGLFASYNIIQKHRGQIKVASRPGEGSSFTVVLPITAE